MRVGLIIYGRLDTLSGGYLYDRILVDYLRAQGDHVTVFSLPEADYRGQLAQNFDTSFYRLLRHAQIDVLVQDELCHPSLIWHNRRLRSQVDYPIVSLIHHLRVSERHPAMLMPLYRVVERAYLRSVDAWIVNSRDTLGASQVLGRSEQPTLVATPGGDRFPDIPTLDAISSQRREDGPLRILFLGNLIPRKGLTVLLDALAMLPRDSWRLTVAGRLDVDADYVEAVREQIARQGLHEAVTLTGRLDGEELTDALRSHDVLAVPSYHEGFGMVYLEAMGFGVVPLATTAGAAKEFIRDGVSGFLVPSGDPGAIADRLRKLIDDRDQLGAMQIAARKAFDAMPTWNETCASIRAFLQSL